MYVPVDPKIVMFCQIKYYNRYDSSIAEPPYVMMVLTALKRLNFRVHPPTCRPPNGIDLIYLCEHMGQGIEFDMVQNALNGICQDTLIPFASRAFRSKDGYLSIRWVCG